MDGDQQAGEFRLEFTSTLTREDWWEFVQVSSARLRNPRVAIASATIGVALVLVMHWLGDWRMVTGLLAGVLAIGGLLWFQQHRGGPDPDGLFFGERIIRVSPEGVDVNFLGCTSAYRWSTFTDVTLTGNHLILWLDRCTAHLVPRRDLPGDVDAEGLAAWMGERIAADRPEGAARPVSVESSAGVVGGGPLRRWLGRPVPNAWVVVALVALNVGIWMALQRLEAGPDAQFSLYGAPGIVWNGLPVLMAAWAISVASRPPVGYRRALCLVLAAAPAVVILDQVWWRLGVDGGALGWLLGAAAVLVLLRIATGKIQALALVLMLVGVAGFSWLDRMTYVDASVWFVSEAAADDTRREWQQSEEVLFSQAGAIDEAVDAMAPRQGAASAFFIGFAGYAEQKVFAEEIRFAADVLGRRYGSRDRTLLLLNDGRDGAAGPIASATGLRYGLQRVAARMDLDRDLLVLALSSHGSPDTLAVSNGMLPLRNLEAGFLKSALEEAGIRWRVVVVSSCYAGSFLDELSNPETVIVASAAPDRTSFGCSNDRELTYFGAAFYRDALPGAETLRGAFGLARTLVTERERTAGYQPSSPVAFFGEELERRLETMTHRPRHQGDV